MNNAVRNTEFRARVTQLGYLGIGISDIVAWRDFAENVLGVQISDETEDGSLFLRTDAYHHRLILRPTGEDDVVFVGWEVKDAEALDLMAQQIRAYGLAVIEGTPEDCAERMVLGLIKFIDPDGLAVEIYYGGRLDHRPFVSPRGVRGFAADGLGLGHIVLAADEPVSYVAFYMDVLGTRLSDYILFSTPERQAKVAFMHVNPRHHSLAVSPRRAAQPGAPAQKRISHFMLELKDIDDVGVALSLFIGADPNASWIAGCVETDDHGFVLTGGGSLPLETSRSGVFAIGDVRSGSVKRVAAGVGEGAAVVAQIHKVLAAQVSSNAGH